jgi:hypothetical protein
MTVDDFDSWMNDYCEAFPETLAWINQSPNVQATLRHWQTALASVELGDALEVTQRLLRGDEEPIKPYDREQTPAIVRRLAGLQAERRRRGPVEKTDELPEYMTARLDRQTFEMAPTLRQIRDAIAEGKTKEEIQNSILPKMADEDRNRYRCLICKDTGHLQVWSGTSMLAAVDGTFGQSRTVYAIEVGCNCVWYSEKYPESTFRKFDSAYMIPCPRGVKDSEHVNELRYRSEKLMATAKVQEFDAGDFGQQFR